MLKDGIVADCNQKALDLLKTTRKNVIGKLPLLFSPETQPDGSSSEDEILKKQNIELLDIPQFFEWRFCKQDGALFDTEVSLTRFKISDSVHALAIVCDISEREKMIQNLKHREK